jgi:hypothetical protein
MHRLHEYSFDSFFHWKGVSVELCNVIFYKIFWSPKYDTPYLCNQKSILLKTWINFLKLQSLVLDKKGLNQYKLHLSSLPNTISLNASLKLINSSTWTFQ